MQGFLIGSVRIPDENHRSALIYSIIFTWFLSADNGKNDTIRLRLFKEWITLSTEDNRYPADNMLISWSTLYPLDSDSSTG